jgi:hypothetical protein
MGWYLVGLPFISSRKRKYMTCYFDWKVLKLLYPCGNNEYPFNHWKRNSRDRLQSVDPTADQTPWTFNSAGGSGAAWCTRRFSSANSKCGSPVIVPKNSIRPSEIHHNIYRQCLVLGLFTRGEYARRTDFMLEVGLIVALALCGSKVA